MSSNSILSSGESEKRWVLAMEKKFPQHHILNIDFNTSFCVYKIKTQSQAKPEAYAPQQLGLGPLHHLRPHLYPMHNHKLAAVTELLPPQKLQNFHLLIDALLPLEPLVRACYDQYLDLDIETLAWIFSIDGLYLLHFLKNYPETKHLAGDVLMLENQIPLVLLNKILKFLKLDLENLQFFLQDQSPLELENTAEMGDADNDAHLLHRIYNLIVNKNASPFRTCYMAMGRPRITLEEIAKSVQFLMDLGLPGAGAAAKILSFVKNIPWEKILSMFEKNEETPSSDEIEIPSVSQMAEIAGIKFILTRGGIRNIRFDNQQKKFYLPSMKFTATSEIVLRNLVAYEAASAQAGERLELAEYVDLMCGIIDSAKDVAFLRKEGIIVQSGELDDDDKIALIFNSISKSEKKKTDDLDKTNVEEAVDDVNVSYNNSVRVKVGKLVWKYAYACFKVLSVLITIAVLVLLTLQAFCSVFGCGRWFNTIAATTQSDGSLVSYQ